VTTKKGGILSLSLLENAKKAKIFGTTIAPLIFKQIIQDELNFVPSTLLVFY